MKRLLLISITLLLLISCNRIIFREVNCRDFEFQDDLKWYAGNVGNTITLSNKMFAQVLIFEYAHTEKNQFKKIVIAPEIGIVELNETNGDVWRNTDLETKLNIDISSFEYSENICE